MGLQLEDSLPGEGYESSPEGGFLKLLEEATLEALQKTKRKRRFFRLCPWDLLTDTFWLDWGQGCMATARFMPGI